MKRIIILLFSLPLLLAGCGIGAQNLRRTGDTLHPHSGGHPGQSQISALRVQQLGGILSGKVRDGKPADAAALKRLLKK